MGPMETKDRPDPMFDTTYPVPIEEVDRLFGEISDEVRDIYAQHMKDIRSTPSRDHPKPPGYDFLAPYHIRKDEDYIPIQETKYVREGTLTTRYYWEAKYLELAPGITAWLKSKGIKSLPKTEEVPPRRGPV